MCRYHQVVEDGRAGAQKQFYFGISSDIFDGSDQHLVARGSELRGVNGRIYLGDDKSCEKDAAANHSVVKSLSFAMNRAYLTKNV